MGEPGKAMMGTALAAGPDRARIAAEQAVACPLLEGIDLSGARGVLVLISAAKGCLKLSESKVAMNTIRNFAAADAHVIYGTAYDDNLGDQIRVTVVATGLSRSRPKLQVMPGSQPQILQRTGTHDIAFQVPTLDSPVHVGQIGGTIGSAIGRAAQPNYDSMATPSVWRTRDRTSAAAKVDALSNGGMDDFEIPAFLRKQAD
jgi:cell division protein FtsZ